MDIEFINIVNIVVVLLLLNSLFFSVLTLFVQEFFFGDLNFFLNKNWIKSMSARERGSVSMSLKIMNWKLTIIINFIYPDNAFLVKFYDSFWITSHKTVSQSAIKCENKLKKNK